MNRIILENDCRNMLSSITNDEVTTLKNKSILITGATGMLASYIAFFLNHLNKYYQLNLKILLLYRNPDKAHEKLGGLLTEKNVLSICQDVCEPIHYDGTVDFIVHGASAADAHSIIHNPIGIIQANTTGTFQVCEFARGHNSTILFLSTREVYGKIGTEIREIKEDMTGVLDPLDSRSCYPESKRCAETILQAYANQFCVPFRIARIAHVYGPGMAISNDGRIMSDLIGNVVRNENITLKSDGTALRAFCYISDATIALLKIMLSDENGGVYNVANEDEEISILQLAQLLCDLYSEKNLHINFIGMNEAERKGYLGIERVKLNTDRLRNLGWKPQVSLADGLKNTVNNYIL